MKYLLTIIACIVVSLPASNAQDSKNEKIIRDYFDGWVKKDWRLVEAQLANGFTFTSAAPDDHISVEKFREKCWVQADHIRRLDFIRFIGNDSEMMAVVHVITTDNKTIRNIEYFNFSNGKIKSIEVFFGGAGRGFPTNVR